jgi:hypothetical protein
MQGDFPAATVSHVTQQASTLSLQRRQPPLKEATTAGMMLEVVGAVLEDGNNMTRNTAARTAIVAL